ncbi:MAG TPA: type II toxin-antitoxin system Phd/YefM family antitoxin [Candidatus Rubrimentiphilum sp.]|nr:type II toxin-antitoxin system Phd/YefM family antitoxin [Candidatus Rubrimentiphilum sp.]
MSTVLKTVQAKEARANLSELLDRVAEGESRLIIRNSKPAAALVPPEQARWLGYLGEILAEFAESLEISGDQDLVEQVKIANQEVAEGNIVWYES